MTVEKLVADALAALANGNVFPDVAPAGTSKPWITYQSVGGQDFTDLSGETSGTRNGRVQISVWAATRLGAANLMEQVYQALVPLPTCAVPIGGPVSTFEEATQLYGSSLDFSITY